MYNILVRYKFQIKFDNDPLMILKNEPIQNRSS